MNRQAQKEKLKPEKQNAMCSYKINSAAIKGIEKEVIEEIKTAYQNAGQNCYITYPER